MIQLKKIFILLAILFCSGSFLKSWSQQVYPVSASSQLAPPNSLYIADYFETGGNLWKINLNFLDFVEPSRDVYLKLKIESNVVNLISIPGTYPQGGVFTLIPGQSQLISGNLLEPYFDSQFMNLSGMSWSQLTQNGRLPEGFYTFCVEVVDVYSGEILSVQSCNSAWLRLNDQPIINTPICGNVINTSVPINLPIQWQSNNLLSPNGMMSTQYQLNVFEVTDLTVSPLTAVNNGNAISVFQSPWSNQPSYVYDISSPSLEEGKCYAFNVQARDNSGRDLFKNNGFSEFCWFYYGYPAGGILPLIQPLDSAVIGKFQQQYFKWGAGANFLPSQPIEYTLEIAEVDSNQLATDAMSNNAPWHSEVFPVNYNGVGLDFELSKQQKAFEKGQRYAWQVSASSNGQNVATSPTYTFLGPAIVDEFYVNNHLVEVISLSTSDLYSLSGVGRVAISTTGTEYALVNFNDISVVNYGGIFFLSSGELYGAVDSPTETIIDLTPLITENGTASAEITEVRLSNQWDLDVRAEIEWEFPLLVNTSGMPLWNSQLDWYHYTGYQLNGGTHGLEENRYQLLEPYGFDFVLNEATAFNVSNNQFGVALNGAVEVPDFIEGFTNGVRVKYLFEDQNQPFYIQDNKTHYSSNLLPIGSVNVKVEPTVYTIDLSNDLSPGKFQADNSWMGVYLNTYELKFNTTGYSLEALQFSADISKTVNLVDQDSTRAWITTNGLSFLAEESFQTNQAVTYNTFPGAIDYARIEVENSALTNSYLLGNIKVPFLSETEEFDFTVPMSIYGYNQGYLNESIDSTAYVFNAGEGDNEIFITVNRAVFEDNQKLNMNIGLSWPGMGIEVVDADGFMIWGNYNVGFGAPNGVLALQEELEGVSNGNEILARYIGAGRNANLYSIGLNGDLQLGEDIAGENGPPVFNGYSILESTIIPENYTPGTLYNFGNPTSVGDYSNGNTTGVGGVSFGDTTNSDLSFAMNVFGDALAANNTTPEFESGTDNDSIPLPGSPVFDETGMNPSEILEQIVSFIDMVSPFMPDSLKAKSLALKLKIETLESSELYAIYMELEENGFDLKKILKAQVDKAISLINGKISNGIDNLNGEIEGAILNPVDSLVAKANELIEDIIDDVADQVLQMMSGSPNLASSLDAAAQTAKTSLTTELRASVLNSVKTNITDKITVFIDTVFKLQVTAFITEEVTNLGYAIIDGNSEDIEFAGIVDNADALLENIKDDIVTAFKSVSIAGVRSTAKSTVDDALAGIDWPKIGDDIKNAVINDLGGALSDSIMSGIGNLFGDSSLMTGMMANVLENFEFDFSNLGDKIANGDIGDIVKFDPTRIKISSKVADIDGMITCKEDSIWGKVWMANLAADIKKPKPISAYVKFINGKVNNYNYWFLELAIDKGLGIPFAGGTMLDGIGGKVFKHMKYVRNETDHTLSQYMPTDTINFGVGVSLWITDNNPNAAKRGDLLKLKVGAEVQIMENDFTMEIRGDLAINNSSPAKDAPFTSALATGSGFLGFSSINKQLLGQFNIDTKITPLICGGGQLGLNVYPGYWNLYIGKKLDPIVIKLLCKDPLAINAWFDISSTQLQFGVESQFDFAVASPWFKIGRYWRPHAAFGWHFLVELDMQYKPDFVINNAQILMHIYANLGIDWEKRNGSGDVTDSGDIILAAVELYGNVQYSQNSVESRFQGQLAGNITVLTIGIGFDVSVDKTM